ncbi:ATP-binding protein [Christensenella tenuis]|jgi:serine/threonine-protein kinase RsbW|uniref:Anti-sigma factor n=1 Tax=Christensenella tenuis TaxID=2763033 RepID=A0ABR7EAX7_9FIRM|nr:hypothetical protein [Christensenella tenuis]MBC5646917.1 hypothetical protein [Christensenella tenuis]
MTDTVRMKFPAKREYLKAIRLAVAGIACNSAYDVDEIEDLKTCVAESCILFLCRQKSEILEVVVDCGDHVSVTVRGEGRQVVCEECVECTGFSEEISKLMIQSLSDDAEFEEEDGMLRSVSFGKRPAA